MPLWQTLDLSSQAKALPALDLSSQAKALPASASQPLLLTRLDTMGKTLGIASTFSLMKTLYTSP